MPLTREEVNAARRARYQEIRGRVLAYQKQWRNSNKEKVNEQARVRQEKARRAAGVNARRKGRDKDKQRAAKEAYCRRNPYLVKARIKDWRVKQRLAGVSAYDLSKAWKKANREKVNAMEKARRQRFKARLHDAHVRLFWTVWPPAACAIVVARRQKFNARFHCAHVTAYKKHLRADLERKRARDRYHRPEVKAQHKLRAASPERFAQRKLGRHANKVPELVELYALVRKLNRERKPNDQNSR